MNLPPYSRIERTWPRGIPGDYLWVWPVAAGVPVPQERRLVPCFTSKTWVAVERAACRFEGRRAAPDVLEGLRVMIASAIEQERPDLTFRLQGDDPGFITVLWRYRKVPR